MAALLLALALVALLALGACATAAPPEATPGITGVITRLEPLEGGELQLLVEGGEQPPGAVSDKASVRVTAQTEVFDASGAPVDATALAQSDEVDVWFEGAVAESYPVQGTAAAVRLRE